MDKNSLAVLPNHKFYVGINHFRLSGSSIFLDAFNKEITGKVLLISLVQCRKQNSWKKRF